MKAMATIYGQERDDRLARGLLVLLLFASVLVSLWILLGGGDVWLSAHTPLRLEGGDALRRGLLAGALVVLFLRLCATFFVLLPRKIPPAEAMGIPGAFAVYFVGMPLFAAAEPAARPLVAALGILLFGVGSALNTGAELLRAQWKKRPENRGKVYTAGLFRYAVHINYFGDVLWAAGLAVLTGNGWSALVPALLFCFFQFFNAPMLDRHLSARYGSDFDAYKARTPSVIPWPR